MRGIKRGGILRDERGGVIITFALMLNILILAIALSMDLGRGFMASSAIQGASDAAAVASAIKGGDDAQAEAYFKANLPVKTLGIGYNYNTDVAHVVDTANNSVSVTTTGFSVPAFFSRGTAMSNASAGGGGSVGVGGKVAVGLGSSRFEPADYFFIIDASGSMTYGAQPAGTTKAAQTRVALSNFLEIVFANQKMGANGVADYRVSMSNYGTGLVNSFPLTDTKETLLSQASIMTLPPTTQDSGNTCGGCGIEAAKKQLEAEIKAHPQNNNRPRIFVFMTDGSLNEPAKEEDIFPDDYKGKKIHRETDYVNGGIYELDPSYPHGWAATLCKSIKEDLPDQNVSIWTIRFGEVDPVDVGTNKDVMTYCASDPKQSLEAKTGSELDEIFSMIGKTTSRIRITK